MEEGIYGMEEGIDEGIYGIPPIPGYPNIIMGFINCCGICAICYIWSCCGGMKNGYCIWFCYIGI